MSLSISRSRWAAIGAAIAVSLGAGGFGLVRATAPVGAAAFVPITPCRVIDTRAGDYNVGPRSTPLGPDETYTVTAHGTNGLCTGIPATATGLVLNVTALNATQPTYLTIWADGPTRPTASSLNPAPGQPPTPNAVSTQLSAAGRFNIYNLAGTVEVLADIVGYYIDHNHDDRYFAKAETDSRYLGLDNNVMRLHTTDFDYYPNEKWAPVPLQHYDPTVYPECAWIAVEAPIGATLKSIQLTYQAAVPADVQLAMVGFRNTPGSATVGAVDTTQLAPVVAPVSGAGPSAGLTGTFAGLTVAFPAGRTVRAGFDYTITLCTDDAIIFYGASLTIA